MNGPTDAVVELAEVPPLSTSFAQGLARSAAAAASRVRTVPPDALPPVALSARGLTADPDRLSDYQHLVGETASDLLPPGFVHVLAFPLATALLVRPDVPLPLLGMVHLANTVTQHRPVRLEERLDAVAHLAALRAHHRGVSLDVVVDASVDGEPVWRGTSTYLAKGYRLDGGARPEPPERPEWQAPSPTGTWRLDAGIGRRYAAVSGDHNPIHTSPLAAKAFGFPRAIAHGMYTAARALAEAGYGPALTWTAEFAAPLTLPGTVSVAVRDGGSGGGGGGADGVRTVDVWGKRPHLRVSLSPPSS